MYNMASYGGTLIRDKQFKVFDTSRRHKNIQRSETSIGAKKLEQSPKTRVPHMRIRESVLKNTTRCTHRGAHA